MLRVMVGTKRRHIGLGGFPDVPLAQAKERARKAREEVAKGFDPIVQKREAASQLRAKQASAITFEKAAEAYVEAHGESWRNAKHRAQWLSTLKTYAYPTVGDLLVQDVEQEHVLKILEPRPRPRLRPGCEGGWRPCWTGLPFATIAPATAKSIECP